MAWLKGAFLAIAGAFPAAAILAIVHRFPVAFDDARVHENSARAAMFTVAFALVGGHVFILAGLGVAATGLAKLTGPGQAGSTARIAIFALLASFGWALYVIV